ncbi:DsbA family protein [Albimonas sp. CAU 1670]|uniref:DsbA family oxidoreductase n=1 Tax=Albimonas sp. CAU 1670 TaxID=3032599 RepID=UPI0023D9F8A8|nr:DsbA family protein [Albimonas sp. CAU 1670]MDF2230941.1 DsbA family protein [Albimonas sp. CAU 1670]
MAGAPSPARPGAGAPRLTLEFFHDVVCGWCFNLSPRLRALAAELPIEVRHRAFVLQDSQARMAEVFGSPARAKAEILRHWQACRAASDAPERIDVARMRAAPFPYPHGLPGALACKAAERLGGRDAHWAMFDALQRAHLSEARNVADPAVLVETAAALGLGPGFARLMEAPGVRAAVEADRALARRLGIRTVPSLILREGRVRLDHGSPGALRAQLLDALRRAA